MMLLRKSLICVWALLGAACTTIGTHDHTARAALDYGTPTTVRVCVLREASIPAASVEALIEALQEEMTPYAIRVELARVEVAPRGGFTVWGILGALQSTELPAGCDFLLQLVGRHMGDSAWMLLPLPEVLGAVDAIGGRRLYVAATTTMLSLNQRVSPPREVLKHEFYHLLGCQHAMSMRDCYESVARWKRSRQSEEVAGR